jgi:hypothetical protein
LAQLRHVPSAKWSAEAPVEDQHYVALPQARGPEGTGGVAPPSPSNGSESALKPWLAG